MMAEKYAVEIAALIRQVKEPYRSHLLIWIENMTGKSVQGENLSYCLSHWLHSFDAISMFDQYKLLQTVCKEAAKIFGDNGNERGKSSG